ncbi:DUF4276 family protein [Ottowia sp.]|uniref:DUF4276 family protein n=1 Tax=Ottowia sp. TaxID=1898956 RepID=UPI003A88DEB2
MVAVVVIVEGQTEERFVKQLVAPALRHLKIFLKPELLPTSRTGKGGAVSFDRFKFHAVNALKNQKTDVVTTFLDLYALDTRFPGFGDALTKGTLDAKVECLNQSLHEALVAHAGCRPERFIAHIQPHEYEGLLFSDVEALCRIEPDWAVCAHHLTKVRGGYDTPEHINDGFETKPSKRLESTLTPKYKKTRHGPLAAESITLSVIERECRHFRTWINKLRALTSSTV